jgi:hypothetical protein
MKRIRQKAGSIVKEREFGNLNSCTNVDPWDLPVWQLLSAKLADLASF